MSAKVLTESSATLAKSGNRWRAVLAKPGQGTSGFYSEDMLREFGPGALAPGAKAFLDHDPKRSARDMIGFYPDGAVYEDGVGLVGDLEVFSHWKDFVEEVGPHAGLSIYMMGETDKDGNVTKLLPHRTNGVDLVGYPGLEGSGIAEKIESLIESAQAQTDNKPGAASAQEREGTTNMEEKLDKLIALFETFVTESKAEKDAAPAVETQVSDAVEAFATAVKTVEDAELLPSQRESLLAEAKSGKDIAPLVEAAKKIRDEALALVREDGTAGRVLESASGNEDYTTTGMRAR